MSLVCGYSALRQQGLRSQAYRSLSLRSRRRQHPVGRTSVSFYALPTNPVIFLLRTLFQVFKEDRNLGSPLAFKPLVIIWLLKTTGKQKKTLKYFIFVRTNWVSLVAQMVKNLPAMQETHGLIPGLRRSSGEGKGYPLQYSGLENSMDCTYSP